MSALVPIALAAAGLAAILVHALRAWDEAKEAEQRLAAMRQDYADEIDEERRP